MGDIAFVDHQSLHRGLHQGCERLQDPQVEVIVPGHGPVGEKKDLVEMRDYLALLLREGRRPRAGIGGAGRGSSTSASRHLDGSGVVNT